MMREFTLVERLVGRINTQFRRIVTSLTVPESLPLLEKLYQFEPRAMRDLFSVGSPAVECAFKVCCTWGVKNGARSICGATS